MCQVIITISGVALSKNLKTFKKFLANMLWGIDTHSAAECPINGFSYLNSTIFMLRESNPTFLVVL